MSQTTLHTVPADIQPLSLSSSAEAAAYAAQSSESGFAHLAGAAITVTKGASAVLRYNAIMTAVSSEELDEYSEEFEKMLTKDERAAYSRSRQNYYGGLNIPMLLWIGINLDGNVSREDMEHARRTQLKYDEKARYIAQKLRDHKSTTVKIRGRLTATGVSFIPTVAEAYIKVAKVMLNDGSVLTVASSSANDVAAASNDGSVVPSSDGKLNIV